MGYLRAELDFAAIDTIDVLNKLRRLTMVGTIEVDFPKFASYCNRMLPQYYKTLKSMIGPAGPAVRFVRIGCHAPEVGVPQG